ncbi:MAG: tetratricopeptide repeat protein [Fibrobacterota bacterium]
MYKPVFLIFTVLSFFSMAVGEGFISYRLGQQYKEAGNNEMALSEFHRVIATYPEHYNAHYSIGEIQKEQGLYEHAEHSFKSALRYNPGWVDAYKQLARVYELQGDTEAAVEILQEAEGEAREDEREEIQETIDSLVRRTGEEDPPKEDAQQEEVSDEPVRAAEDASDGTEVDTREVPPGARDELQKAIDLYRTGVREGDNAFLHEAIEHVRSAIALHPGYPGAYYYGGVIRRRLGQDDMARVNFEKALSDPEKGYNAHFYLGRIYGEKQEYETAIEHLQDYVELTDYQPGIREAQSLMENYEQEIAEEEEEKLRAETDMYRKPIEDEMRALPKQQRFTPYEIRIDTLLTMVMVDSTTDEGQDMLQGYRNYEDNKIDRSIEAFYDVLETYGTGQAAEFSTYNIGVGRMLLRDWDGAVEAFQQYRNRFPRGSLSEKAEFFSALASYEMGDYERGENMFRRYLSTYPEGEFTAKAYEKMGDIHRRMDRQNQALAAYEKAVTVADTPADRMYALYKKGTLYEELNNRDDAVAVFRDVIDTGEEAEIYDRVPQAYYKTADLLYQNERYDAAEEYYTKAIRLFPDYPDTPWGLFQRGNIKRRQKEFDEAVEIYEQIMVDYPDDYWAEQAQWRKKNTIWEYQYGQ